ncbi:phage holin family protein [Brevibacterium daeguense]|uniref:Phage holin family protein n=1 Tax=Brevibacterium daeguense TaxID=909936 RepID=A0ABP8ENF7_9MICO|nr:phage holin family protein [Brevibacterium daeguense]
MNFLLRIIINALAIWIAVWLLPGMTITGSEWLAGSLGETGSAVVAYLVIGLIFGLVNAVVRPIVAFVSIPITCLTLGLFGFVINAAMLLLTAWLSGFTPIVLQIDTFFWTALLAAIIVTVVSAVAETLLPDRAERQRD